MKIGEYFPFWAQLTPSQKRELEEAVTERRARKGDILHNGPEDCVGLLLVTSGRLRAYMLSDEGKEITLFRLPEGDLCLFSASCILHGIQFDVTVEAETDAKFLHVPPAVYRKLSGESAAVANFTGELMANRLSEVMWVLDQVLNKKMDSRLAAFLIEQSRLSGEDELKITHEEIARHLGSAREVITRMLKYLGEKGLISLSRGTIRIADRKGLAKLAADSLRQV